MPKKRKTIIWVDDERFALTNYKTLLEAKGYNVLCAYSLNEGKKYVKENHEIIDLIIIDIMMDLGDEMELDESDSELAKGGYESGLVLARWIKKHYSRLPILICSAFADEGARRWFEENAVGYLPKHELLGMRDLDSLVEYIDNVINPHRRMKERIKTFIVHGHDDKAKLELKNYIQNSLQLGEPIILHEQPSFGRTIIEKFEEEVRGANLVFVLLTPDDAIYDPIATDNMKKRARQNVIFELGYLLAKLERKRGRVLLLHKGELDIPSDILGLIYIDITNGIEAAGEQIRRELRGIV
jgi:CheY-like chemotaxis protein